MESWVIARGAVASAPRSGTRWLPLSCSWRCPWCRLDLAGWAIWSTGSMAETPPLHLLRGAQTQRSGPIGALRQGRCPVASRSSEAFTLQLRLASETGVVVAVQWDSSSASHGFKWHVLWANGPTIDGMTALVDRLLPATSALDRTTLVYLRTVQPISVAMAIVRNLRLNLPALGEHRSGWGLEEHLRDVPYPERGVDEDIELATELLRLTPEGSARDLADTAGRYGLTGLHARVAPPDNVVPFRRARRR
jgi:hypothetical protein